MHRESEICKDGISKSQVKAIRVKRFSYQQLRAKRFASEKKKQKTKTQMEDFKEIF